MTPVVVYVDDEPHNLVVFEAALPPEWKVITYDSPVQALQALDEIVPSIIVSDQRMPGMNGVQFLELSCKIHPNAVRIMVTGYSDEDLVVESVRKAHIFDYIRKPWDVGDLVASLTRAFEFFESAERARRLQEKLRHRELELMDQNTRLTSVLNELETAKRHESELRQELECWVPPFVLRALRDKAVKFPITRDITCITYDIVNSSRLHPYQANGRPLRGQVIQLFSEAIIRHGGWRESSAGDSAYGHFGLFQERENPADAALAVAREFRVAVSNLAAMTGVPFECGIALHVARNALVDIHSVHIQTPDGTMTQKSFDTTSPDIDLLHRMEKKVHGLPGSNIILSRAFLDALKNPPAQVQAIGTHTFPGHANPVELFLLPSEEVNGDHLASLNVKAA